LIAIYCDQKKLEIITVVYCWQVDIGQQRKTKAVKNIKETLNQGQI
jgi:hypothetical protein